MHAESSRDSATLGVGEVIRSAGTQEQQQQMPTTKTRAKRAAAKAKASAVKIHADAVLPDEAVEVWERQKSETPEAFAAWVVYRDMTGKRTVRGVAEQLKKALSLIYGWSSEWNWQERLLSYQRHVDEQVRQAQLEEIKKYRARTSRNMMAKQQTLMLADMLINKKLAEGMPIEKLLAGMSNRDLVLLSIKSAQALPHIAKAEALALGDVTDRPELADQPLDVLTERLARNPEARATAARLIQEMSQ